MHIMMPDALRLVDGPVTTIGSVLSTARCSLVAISSTEYVLPIDRNATGAWCDLAPSSAGYVLQILRFRSS